MKTAVIIHGLPTKEEYYDKEGDSESNCHWLPWLQKQLITSGVLAQTPEMPIPYDPNYKEWKEILMSFKLDRDTILVGHSCGAGFIARFLSEENIQVGKVVLVAPWVDPKKRVTQNMFDFTLDKYFLMMLLSGIFLGILITSERYLQKITGFTTGTILSWWSVCITLGLVTFFTKNKHTYNKKDLVVTGTLRFLQNLSWVILVYTVGNLSMVSAITTFKVVLMFILGAVFLGEKEDMKRKIVGSIVAVIGLLIMK